MAKRVPYPRSNAAIALHLLSKFRGLIYSISYKMGARYWLSTEDRQDLVHAAEAKISTTKWRTVLRRGGNRPLENYVISTIQTTMSKELRRIKAGGLSGLSKGPKINEFPQYQDSHIVAWENSYDPTCREHASHQLVNLEDRHQDANTVTDKLAAQELADRAVLLLTPEEWQVVNLVFGFDDKPKTTAEVAKHLDIQVSKVEITLERSLQKLRRTLR